MQIQYYIHTPKGDFIACLVIGPTESICKVCKFDNSGELISSLCFCLAINVGYVSSTKDIQLPSYLGMGYMPLHIYVSTR